jgi:hypothetical protein
MRGCLKGCLTSVGLLVVLTSVAYAGWRWGEPVFPWIESVTGVERDTVGADDLSSAPSPELASATLERIEALQAGAAGSRLALDGAELTSLIRHGLPGIVPAGVGEPTVRMDDDRVTLSGRVALDAFRDLQGFDEVAGLLPDTVDVVLKGVLMGLDDAHAAFQIDRVEASRVPLPRRLIPGILGALGREERPGLPSTALAIPLPPGLAAAYVQSGQLVLVADR